MEKDTRLINIYLNIHNKKTLTMDDLRYLAQYAPECFEKTCKNVVYNIPETKPIMDPTAASGEDDKLQQQAFSGQQTNSQMQEVSKQHAENENLPELAVSQNIEQILENLKRLESNDFPVADISAREVKDLLGNLYMELLFPHNDKDTFFNTAGGENVSIFDRKI